jgi:Ca2+-binding RTX toxin-like protein
MPVPQQVSLSHCQAAWLWGGAGNDTLTGIENLVGSGFDDILTGDAGANVLSAGAGADSLDGGAGADTLNGGAGADTYWVDNVSDLVIDASGADMDTVNASVSFSLAQFLDKLVLTGSASINGVGNELGNVIDGNASTNALDGGGGNDTLIGHAGNDTLTGGTGVDNFVMNAADSGMDRITDLAIGDRIQIVQGGSVPSFSGFVTSGSGANVGLNQVQAQSSAGITTLYVGLDSVAGADLAIEVQGNVLLSEFLLNGDSIVRQAFMPNQAPVGAVEFTGAIMQGQLLTAANTLTDGNGLGAIGYQWQVSANGAGGVGRYQWRVNKWICTDPK